MLPNDIHLHIPWIHIKEFFFCFHSLYMECSKSHFPVPLWHFFRALLWLVDGLQGLNHFLYFPITHVNLNPLHMWVHTNIIWCWGGLKCIWWKYINSDHLNTYYWHSTILSAIFLTTIVKTHLLNCNEVRVTDSHILSTLKSTWDWY